MVDRLTRINPAKIIVVGMLLAMIPLLGSCHSSKHYATDKLSRKEYIRQINDDNNLTRQQKLLIEEAFSWLGTPYAYARQDKGAGTDCSGMVMSVYRDALGINLPRSSAKQAEYCDKIEGDEVGIGDLVFFATGKNRKSISHVGIMVDSDRFIHSSSSKGVVVSGLNTPYYTKRLIMYGRVPHLANGNQ